MTRSRRARREAARERARRAPAAEQLAGGQRQTVASQPPAKPRGKVMRSRPPRPWYRDPRFQQSAFFVVSALAIAGLSYFFYNQQQQSVQPLPTPTTPISVSTTAPSTPLAASPTSAAAATSSPSARKTYSAPPAMAIDVSKSYIATIDTVRGTIVVQLNAQDAPKTVNNFVTLARDGFYDGLTFHRVEDWVLQGGDPSGNGTGGPGYKFEDEPVKGDYTVGAFAMANSGPNTNGSQFFIIKRDTPLPKQYNLFGRVTTGIDVVNQMKIGDRINKVTINES